MRDLWFYSWLSRFRFLNYRAKIMVTAFIGTHIPLICLASYFAFQSTPDWPTFVATVGITLLATLAGTGLTLYILNDLLRPVIATSRALRAYREDRNRLPLPSHFTDEVGSLMADAGRTIDHLEAVRDALEHLDESTGLPNRRRLLLIMAARMERKEAFVTAVLRFSKFNRIVEALDPEQAEIAVRILARRLAEKVSDDALLARAGKSKFAILLPPSAADPDAAQRVTDLAKACEGEIALAGLIIQPRLYGGIARHPEDGEDATVLLDHAVAAAGAANSATRIQHHSPEVRSAAKVRLKMEQELRRALDQEEFRLHYQPIIDLGSGSVRGAEALIRWQHPEQGLIPPARFIPTAEASGLIEPMGLWVLRQACAQVKEWNRGGNVGLTVAVNLSARQFLDPHLKRQVTEALDRTGISPSQLEIELTETAAMADHDYTRKVFSMLRDLGVSIAIDDFGTGYASMSYLRKLPFDKLKIDREFVTDVHKQREAQAICGALVTLSRGLGLQVLAEGAETEEEVRYLKGLGCELFQGYFFARPLPAEAFRETINEVTLRSLLARLGESAAKPLPEDMARIG